MSRRWTDFDTDAYRLPAGFTRVGYDSNTRRYRFSDDEGRVYQGEPGEEFGGRLTPMNGIDPSLRHRFAPDDDEVENGSLVDSPHSASEAGARRLLVPITQPRQNTRANPTTGASSFSDFLSSSQMATAPSLDSPQKKPSNRGLTSSLRRVTTLMGFRSTRSKVRSVTLPNPSPKADEWGLAHS